MDDISEERERCDNRLPMKNSLTQKKDFAFLFEFPTILLDLLVDCITPFPCILFISWRQTIPHCSSRFRPEVVASGWMIENQDLKIVNLDIWGQSKVVKEWIDQGGYEVGWRIWMSGSQLSRRLWLGRRRNDCLDDLRRLLEMLTNWLKQQQSRLDFTIDDSRRRSNNRTQSTSELIS